MCLFPIGEISTFSIGLLVLSVHFLKNQLEYLLLKRNLLDTTLVAATFEGSREELVHDSFGSLVVDETAWKYQDISIIMLTDEMSNLLVPCQTSTYTLMLVQGHGDTLATTADTDTRINLAALDTLTKCMTEVWVVNAFVAICTIILYRITFLLQLLQFKLFHWETCVIACNSYCLYFHKT